MPIEHVHVRVSLHHISSGLINVRVTESKFKWNKLFVFMCYIQTCPAVILSLKGCKL